MWTFTVVELDPLADTALGLWSDRPGVQVDAFVCQGSQKPRDEDVVEEPAFASMERRMPDRRKQSVQANNVNCDP